MAGWGSGEGGRGQDVGGPACRGEGLWVGPGLCSLALPWCMNSVTAASFSAEVKLEVWRPHLI